MDAHLALIHAVISICLGAAPLQCERHEIRIERSACGLTKHAEVPVGGEWRPAEARIICEGRL